MHNKLVSSLQNLSLRCGNAVLKHSDYVHSARYEKPKQMALIREWTENELVMLREAIDEALSAIKEHQSSDDK